MSAAGQTSAHSTRGPNRRPVDVLVVSLGATIGLRVADEQLVDDLRGAGLIVELARTELPGEVRTLMLTDLRQALAARRATRRALAHVRPRAVLYSTTTAALLAPVPGAVRFDALAQVTRRGHHGWWQRPLERRRLRRAPLLLPWDEASLVGAPADVLARERLVVPVSIDVDETAEPGADAEARTVIDAAEREHGGRVVAVTYAADAAKKGLDRVLAAWQQIRRPSELLLVTGRTTLPPGVPGDGVLCVGRMTPAGFRGAARQAGVLVTAPRREDYGIAQLEAVAAGARVVTTTAPGPYAALAFLRTSWPEYVVEPPDDHEALARALRHAIDTPLGNQERIRMAEAVAGWRRESVADLVREQLAPRLVAVR